MNIKKISSSFSYTPAVQHKASGLKEETDAAQNDVFIKQNRTSKQISFSGFLSILGRGKSAPADENNPSLSYAQRLQAGLKRISGRDIPAENFKNILDGNDLKKILPSLNIQNFVSSKKNQDAGIYSADLDYITSFSYNGIEDIFDVLNNAADYANRYHKKTGRNFLFSITDNDSISGMEHAVRYIAENPEKFQYLRFVPGVKMSFAHQAPNSNIGFENSRMLVYGINPFSQNLIDYTDDTLKRRRDMVYSFIQRAAELYKSYTYKSDEFAEQNGITLKKDLGQSNLYWRIREYLLSKEDAEMRGRELTPREINKFAEDIFAELDTVYKGSDDFHTTHLFIDNAYNTEDAVVMIKKLFEEYSTHYNPKTGGVESAAENTYSALVNCLDREVQKPVMSLSAPYYLIHHFEKMGAEQFNNTAAFINLLIRLSKGMLIGFESAAPMYDLDRELTSEAVQNFNSQIKQKTGLYETGGSFATREKNELRLPA